MHTKVRLIFLKFTPTKLCNCFLCEAHFEKQCISLWQWAMYITVKQHYMNTNTVLAAGGSHTHYHLFQHQWSSPGFHSLVFKRTKEGSLLESQLFKLEYACKGLFAQLAAKWNQKFRNFFCDRVLYLYFTCWLQVQNHTQSIVCQRS